MSFDTHTRSRPIPAFAPAREGDDLEAARSFVDAVVDAMRVLRTDDADAVHAWLNAVERGAKPLEARAIARAAQTARADVGTPRIADTITSVGALIGQYEMGLVDVEVQIEAGDRVIHDDPYADIRPAPRAPTPAPDGVEARFEEARRLLADLLPEVDAEPHRDALEALVNFRPDACAEAGPEIESEVEPVQVLAGPTLDVEAFLPGLVDHAVGAARRAGKTLTASYASREARLPTHMAAEWKAAAEAAIGAVVATSVQSPERRRASGLTGAAHLSIRAEGTADGALVLRLGCPGMRVPNFAVDAPHSIDARAHDGDVWVEFTTRPESEPSASRDGAGTAA